MYKRTIALALLCLTSFAPIHANAAENNFIKVAECKLPLPSVEIPGGIHNVQHSAKLVNGVTIKPGEIFSYNTVVGPRTIEKGFVWSKSIGWSGGKYVWIDDVGGGVCRTSTAIHQAALRAGLKVLERHNHSLAVDYAVPGQDAAVWYGAWDYKFQNNKDVPIVLKAMVANNELQVSIEELNPYKVTVENKPVELNGIPRLENGHFMIPLRSMASALGGVVVWDELRRSIVLKTDDYTQISLTDCKEVNGITFIKATTLGRLMEYQVQWSENSKTLSFTKSAVAPQKETEIAQATKSKGMKKELF